MGIGGKNRLMGIRLYTSFTNHWKGGEWSVGDGEDQRKHGKELFWFPSWDMMFGDKPNLEKCSNIAFFNGSIE